MSEFKHLYLHDDVVDPVETGCTVSVRNHADSAAFIRQFKIGQITNKSKGWIDREIGAAIADASREMCAFLKQHMLNMSGLMPWREEQDLMVVAMASECVYVTIQKPEKLPRITLGRSEIADEWPRKLNHVQTFFEIGSGTVSNAGPDGGTLQFPFKLRKP